MRSIAGGEPEGNGDSANNSERIYAMPVSCPLAPVFPLNRNTGGRRSVIVRILRGPNVQIAIPKHHGAGNSKPVGERVICPVSSGQYRVGARLLR